jgi:hypothetical protein
LKTLYASLVRPNLKYASCIWPAHQACHFERIERIQHIFLRFSLRRLRWTTNSSPVYDSRCALLGLESIADRRTVASALLIRDLLCGRIDYPHLTSKLRCEQPPHSRRRHAKLVSFFDHTNFGRFELLNNAIINFDRYCDLFGFRNEESIEMYFVAGSS